MLLASLFALALAGAEPQLAQANAPPALSEPALPTSKAQPFVPAPEEPFPIGAPHDDYGLVSWCYGALAGHMDLFKVVKPELDKLPDTNRKETAALDAEQLQAGQEYLALYKKAMEAAEKASPRPINTRGAQAVKSGANIWTPALQADPKTRMWSYLSWDLPGRCETTAERLYEASLLGAQMLGVTIEDDTDKPKGKAKPADDKAANDKAVGDKDAPPQDAPAKAAAAPTPRLRGLE